MSDERTPEQAADDERESALVLDACKKLGEDFDAVVVLCSRHEGSRGTRTISKGAGNWHARYGIVREWLTDFEESIRDEARENAASERRRGP